MPTRLVAALVAPTGLASSGQKSTPSGACGGQCGLAQLSVMSLPKGRWFHWLVDIGNDTMPLEVRALPRVVRCHRKRYAIAVAHLERAGRDEPSGCPGPSVDISSRTGRPCIFGLRAWVRRCAGRARSRRATSSGSDRRRVSAAEGLFGSLGSAGRTRVAGAFVVSVSLWTRGPTGPSTVPRRRPALG